MGCDRNESEGLANVVRGERFDKGCLGVFSRLVVGLWLSSSGRRNPCMDLPGNGDSDGDCEKAPSGMSGCDLLFIMVPSLRGPPSAEVEGAMEEDNLMAISRSSCDSSPNESEKCCLVGKLCPCSACVKYSVLPL